MNAIVKSTEISQRATAIIDPIKSELPFVLPAGVTVDKFKAVFTTAVMNNPDIITKGTPDSLRRELMKCATDGLLPDNRQAAFVLFKGAVKYMPMVQGIIARARELGDLTSITAECVHANDVFEADRADPAKTHHPVSALDTDRGPIIGAYAIFRDNAGAVIHREILTKSDLEKIKRTSKSDTVWGPWEGEMSRKSAIRRGSKYVPLSSVVRQIVNRDDDFVDLNARQKPAIANPLMAPLPDEPMAPLQERLADAVSLCTTMEELKDVEALYDEEIATATEADKEAARLLFNAKTKQIAIEAEATAQRRAEDEAYALNVTETLNAKTTFADLSAYALAEKDRVAALPADLHKPIYDLYAKRRTEFEAKAKAAS